MLSEELRKKLEALESGLAGIGEVAVAVSGGLDSRLLSSVAVKANEDVLCVHFTGAHMADWETERAVEWLEGMDAKYSVLSVEPLAHPAVAMNRRDRCYHCKHALFSAMAAHAPGRVLMDGSNASDHSKYRPGLRALAELGVHSPLAECGISKPEIRLLAHYLGLSEPDQPATPCLLTRFPYNVAVNPVDLDKVATLERHCRDLGFTHFRIRLIDGTPTLFSDPRHHSLTAPFPIIWDDDLSGYWDRPTTP